MNSTSSDNALRALHTALTRVRYLAYTGSDAKQIGRILDAVEYLASIIMRRGETSEEEYLADFRLHLQDIENKFQGFDGLVRVYDEGQMTAQKVAA